MVGEPFCANLLWLKEDSGHAVTSSAPNLQLLQWVQCLATFVPVSPDLSQDVDSVKWLQPKALFELTGLQFMMTLL